jgi:sarcosine oxidase subunit beta
VTGLPRTEYRVAIVGAGIVGLFTALHVVQAGGGPVLIVDRGYLSSGASGRNGGGVRQQWETPETVRLARESVQAYRRFSKELGYNIWFRQGGYLFLATTEREAAQIDQVQKTVHAEGLPARVLTVEQVPEIVPQIETAGIRLATYLPSDGTLYPFPAIWALYEELGRRGVDIALGVEALGIRSDAGRVTALRTSAGEVKTTAVVNAAGGWSAEFAQRCELPIPNRPTRHEILATEPLKPFLTPMVVRLSDGLYFSQTMRGELVGGLTLHHPDAPPSSMPSSPEFLRAMARALLSLMPQLARLNVLRAWSGFYDDTPDGFPLIGADPRVEGFVQANGFGGHGFMLAPASSRRIAQAVLGEPVDLEPALFGPARFLGATPGGRTAERLQLG